MQHRRALIALTIAGLAWGLTVPMTKVLLGWLDPAWTTVARFGLAAPVLAVIGRHHLRSAATPLIAAWGAAGYGVVIVLQNIGIERTSVTHAAVILGAVPILVALATAALGQATAGPRAWTGFAAALAGIGLVAGSGGHASASGDAIMFASAVLSAAMIIAQTSLLPGRDATAVTAVQMTAAAAAVLPLALLAGSPPTGGPTGAELIAGIGLVTVGSLVPYTLYAYGQARTSAEVAGAFVNLEPLVGVALGAMAFGDPFGPVSLAGAGAILFGIALSVVVPAGENGRTRLP
jgi:O-acetylserine/cysteine efflux transporter